MTDPSVDAVVDLYATWGRHRYDEAVTQLDHAVQTAALARSSGASDALVVAALLHDVGHLLHLASIGEAAARTTADLAHERVGAEWLAQVFPVAVTTPIALHVEAKRYRCAVNVGEVELLSVGSQRSLVRQGGPMTSAEVARFEADPHHVDAVALRGWDDGGKDTSGIDVPPFDAYLPLLAQLAL